MGKDLHLLCTKKPQRGRRTGGGGGSGRMAETKWMGRQVCVIGERNKASLGLNCFNYTIPILSNIVMTIRCNKAISSSFLPISSFMTTLTTLCVAVSPK